MRAFQALRDRFRHLFRRSAPPLSGLERKWLTVHSIVPANAEGLHRIERAALGSPCYNTRKRVGRKPFHLENALWLMKSSMRPLMPFRRVSAH